MLSTINLFTDIIIEHTIELQDHRSDLIKTKIKLLLIDGSVISLREIIIQNVLCDYSYQWMTAGNSLIIRCDNAAHYEEIETFPHHKHIGSQENVQASHEQSLYQVLTAINNCYQPNASRNIPLSGPKPMQGKTIMQR